ncbi:MAG TPA: hypothetical protein VGH98_09045 [Gemmatimonadaceae bacterium]|jgi:hypothetical protein
MPHGSQVDQVEQLKREISHRLRPVCDFLSAQDFEQLVERVARVQRKYEQQQTYEILWASRQAAEGHIP